MRRERALPAGDCLSVLRHGQFSRAISSGSRLNDDRNVGKDEARVPVLRNFYATMGLNIAELVFPDKHVDVP